MMETKSKVIILLFILSIWMVVFLGLIPLSPYGWLLLIGTAIFVYIFLTRKRRFRKGNLEKVVEDMEEYMERKAENTEIELEGVEIGEKSENETSAKSMDKGSKD